MVLATLLWGGSFVAARDVLARVHPLPLVFGRFAAASALFGLVLLARRPRLTAATLAVGGASGALAAGCVLFQAIGLTSTTTGSSAFLTCAGTLFAAFFAWPVLGQRPNRTLVSGILLALAGSALLSLRAGLRLGVGEAWTLAGALLYALQIVMLAPFAPRLDPFALAGVQSLAIAALLGPFAGTALGEFRALDAAGWGRFAYLAVAASTAAPLLQVVAQRSLPAGRIGLLFALEPVFALGFALTVGGERFAARWWLGSALILGAVVLVEGRAASASRRRPASG